MPRNKIKVIKMPLEQHEKVRFPSQSFSRMPQLYLELLETPIDEFSIYQK